MGCCMSSKANTDSSPDDPGPKYSPPNQEPITSQAAVAPPPLEEETVKEVLSETPIFPKTKQIPNAQQPSCQDQIFNPREILKEEKTPEISQASEIYSAAESYSTAATATTLTEVRDDEVSSKKRAVNRSPAKAPRKRPYNGERDGLSKPPVRRAPPARRELTGQGRSTPQLNAGSSRAGRDLGERSGRRSRSPVTRRSVAGGGVKGRGGVSPAKVVSDKSGGKASEVGVKIDGKKEERSGNDSVSMQLQQQQQQQQEEENESLDNPLVSLECFIFL